MTGVMSVSTSLISGHKTSSNAKNIISDTDDEDIENNNIMNVDNIGKFYLGNGGIGDTLILLSTFYDEIEDANVIFLANAPQTIIELLDEFPKIKRKLVIQNDFSLLNEFYNHPNCIGTGILPKNLDYNNWYEVDIFKEFGVKEFPEFLSLFPPKRVDPNKKQMFVQLQGSIVEGEGKKRIMTENTLKEIQKIREQGNFEYVGCSEDQYTVRSLAESISLIRGSDVVFSVDSFAKTVSAMSRIKTIVYNSVYSQEYLASFKDNIDYGHYVFLFPWSYVELRKQ